MYYSMSIVLAFLSLIAINNFGVIRLKETEWKCTQTITTNPDKIDKIECIEYQKINNEE